ncbi:MAG: PIG-L deacetylase family protein [Janthinobacterium lividum]
MHEPAASPVVDRAIEGLGTPEAAWLPWLASQHLSTTTAAELVPEGRRAVVIAPHPDDEVLSVGGVLSQLAALGRDILLVAVTDGTGSHDGSSLWGPERLAQVRPVESQRAWAQLGLRNVESRRLNLPDGGLMGARQVLAERIAAVLRPGDVVFTTWRLDGHPDHEATAQACAAVAACMDVRLVEVPVWAWHWASAGDVRMPWRRAQMIALDQETVQQKRNAVQEFESQLESDPSTGAGPILRSTTVQRAHRPFELVFA